MKDKLVVIVDQVNVILERPEVKRRLAELDAREVEERAWQQADEQAWDEEREAQYRYRHQQ